jgi:hypothetical protein
MYSVIHVNDSSEDDDEDLEHVGYGETVEIPRAEDCNE